jgi:hypothetical protein
MIEQVLPGGSGLHVSRPALGMMSWALDEQAAEPIARLPISE